MKFMFLCQCYRPEQADFTVIYDSQSIGAVPDIALFRKVVNRQTRFCPGGLPLSKSHGSCSASFYLLSVRITLKHYIWPCMKTLVSYCFVITYRLFTSAKTDAEISHTYGHVQTDSGQLAFVFVIHWGDVGRAPYLYLNYTKSIHTNWNINVSFAIHVNFDHAWAEHYPITLKTGLDIPVYINLN